MSGLEVILIVGAGIIITKKVKQHRREKKLKELAAAGLLPEQHAPARTVAPQHGRLSVDDSLPVYSPPSKEYLATSGGSGKLPSYDEVRNQNNQTTSGSQSAALNQSSSVSEKKASRKWKLWNREKSVGKGFDTSNCAPLA